MTLILIRHGNTFRPDDTPVWVGRGEDLPLVPSGIAQAQRMAEALARAEVQVEKVYCSPLLRAQMSADALLRSEQEELFPVAREKGVLDCLNEIDYGTWGGKSTEQLRALGLGEELEQWDREALVPNGAGWKSTEEELREQVGDLLRFAAESATDEPCIGVTSNGILKCLARFALDEFPELVASKQLKVGTGKLVWLEQQAGKWKIVHWGISPDELMRN
ncbi:histidine phosphatase family protein [bacterium]|nr:histidine phosphatase family protein [bacterium]